MYCDGSNLISGDKEIDDLIESISKKWECLEKMYELNASDNVRIAIRRAIYKEQDKLIELSSSKNIKYNLDLIHPNKKPILIIR